MATTAEDLAYIAWQESLPGHRDYAERVAQEAYEAWASDRREDGEDDSEEAYADYLEGFLPDE